MVPQLYFADASALTGACCGAPALFAAGCPASHPISRYRGSSRMPTHGNMCFSRDLSSRAQTVSTLTCWFAMHWGVLYSAPVQRSTYFRLSRLRWAFGPAVSRCTSSVIGEGRATSISAQPNPCGVDASPASLRSGFVVDALLRPGAWAVLFRSFQQLVHDLPLDGHVSFLY